jgi:RNA polymerase sigma factor (sigma-70 family)
VKQPYASFFHNWRLTEYRLHFALHRIYPAATGDEIDDMLEDAIVLLIVKLLDGEELEFENEKEICGWVYNAAANNLSNLFKHIERKNRTSIGEVEQMISDNNVAFEFEQQDMIEAMLRVLNQKDRVLFEQHHMSGLTVREIAELHGVPYKTMETRILRIKAKLKTRAKHFPKF